MTGSDRPELWQFWQQTKRELAQVPLETELEPLPEHSSAHLITHRVSFLSLGGVRISGYFTHPLRDREQKFPGLVTLPGYGGGLPPPLDEAAHGYATLALDPRGWGRSAAAYPLERGTITHHPEDLWNCALRGVYADVVRGLDFLQSRPEVDGDRLGVMGTSGGGGLTIAGCSLDDRPIAAAAHVPFLCRLAWAAENVPTSPFREAGEYLEQHPESRGVILANYRYFDPLELAPHLTFPIIVSVGLKDEVCPASTIVPTFERIGGVKALVSYPDLVHAHSRDFYLHMWDWLGTYLRP